MKSQQEILDGLYELEKVFSRSAHSAKLKATKDLSESHHYIPRDTYKDIENYYDNVTGDLRDFIQWVQE